MKNSRYVLSMNDPTKILFDFHLSKKKELKRIIILVITNHTHNNELLTKIKS